MPKRPTYRTKADRRTVEVINVILASGIVSGRPELYEKMDMPKQYFTKIKDGEMSFQDKHREALFRVFGVNANYIFGIEPNMFRECKEANNILSMLKKVENA